MYFACGPSKTQKNYLHIRLMIYYRHHVYKATRKYCTVVKHVKQNSLP